MDPLLNKPIKESNLKGCVPDLPQDGLPLKKEFLLSNANKLKSLILVGSPKALNTSDKEFFIIILLRI